MDTINQSFRRPSRIAITVLGVFLLWWGLTSIASPLYVPNVTITIIDHALAALSQYIWIPAVGLLLTTIGVLAPGSALLRRHRSVQALIVVFGLGFVALGSVLVFITLSRIGGFIYVSPVLLLGIYLLASVWNACHN